MKNLLTTAILILFLSVVVFAQTKQPIKPSEKVVYEYDRFEDKTKISLNLQMAGEPKEVGSLSLLIVTGFDGKKPLEKNVVGFGFFSVDRTKQYGTSHSLIILADNERIKAGDGEYNNKMISVRVVETLAFIVTSDEIKKMAAAKKVEMKLGLKEFTFTAKQLESIRDFYSRLVP